MLRKLDSPLKCTLNHIIYARSRLSVYGFKTQIAPFQSSASQVFLNLVEKNDVLKISMGFSWNRAWKFPEIQTGLSIWDKLKNSFEVPENIFFL